MSPTALAKMIRSVAASFLSLAAYVSLTWPVNAQDDISTPPAETSHSHRRYKLVEVFTGHVLEPGEVKLGFDSDVGVGGRFMVGTDLLATAIGAPTIQTKWQLWHESPHLLAVGLTGAYMSKRTIPWDSIKEDFHTLKAQIIRPSVSWSKLLSDRLTIHTYWSVGIGKVEAELSETGKRKLWESKHPGGDYEKRDESRASSQNLEKRSGSNLAKRTLQVQSLTGMLSDLFQITGEYSRRSGNKILITSRIEKMTIEDLDSSGFRVTAAQQWIWTQFQIRLGVGLQYQVISGRDLDGEAIDDVGVFPASDIDFYWRF